VLPVQSGYRFVLTYNLIDVTRHLSAAVLDVEQSKIHQMLAEWHSMQEKPLFMCYVLERKYSSVSLRRLKGDDNHRCYQLDKACQSNGRFLVFLSQLERTAPRVNDDFLEKWAEQLNLHDIVSLQGTKISHSVRISIDCLVQRDLYEGRKHDELREGNHIQQVYHDTVRVLN
jgi:hypothetical protein